MTTAFGKNLRALRERKNMTQRDLAKALNISNATISSYEKLGQYPQRADIKEGLLKALECSEIDLFGYSDGYFNRMLNDIKNYDADQISSDKNLQNKIKNQINKPFSEQLLYEIFNTNTRPPENLTEIMSDSSMDKIIPEGSSVEFLKEKTLDKCIGHIVLVNVKNKTIIRRLHKIENVDAYILSPESTNAKHQIIQIDSNSDFEILGKAESFTYKGKQL